MVLSSCRDSAQEGLQWKVGSGAGLVGDTLSGKAVAGHGDENTLDGRGLTGTESLNA